MSGSRKSFAMSRKRPKKIQMSRAMVKMLGNLVGGNSDILNMFTPENWGKMNPILTCIFFQMGWFNHQLEDVVSFGRTNRVVLLFLDWND